MQFKFMAGSLHASVAIQKLAQKKGVWGPIRHSATHFYYNAKLSYYSNNIDLRYPLDIYPEFNFNQAWEFISALPNI